MIILYSRKKLFKKLGIGLLTAAILGVATLMVADNMNLIKNFKPYYFHAYTTFWENPTRGTGVGARLASLVLPRSRGDEQPQDLAASFETSVPVLLYHGVIKSDDGSNTTMENFKSQLVALKDAGYHALSLEDFYGFMRGEKQVPPKSFLITFDDGRKDSYYPVDPILRALGLRATMFIITGHTLEAGPSNYYLSAAELEEMKNSGRWDIQPHTYLGHNLFPVDPEGTEGYFYSNKLWLDDKDRMETDEEFLTRVMGDMQRAKEDIERFGVPVAAFAFPFGDYGQTFNNFPQAERLLTNAAKELFPMYFYQLSGGNYTHNYPMPGEESFFVRRITVRPEWSASELLNYLERGADKEMPFNDDFGAHRGWMEAWGNARLESEKLSLASALSTTGAISLLDGTYLWTDYLFEARATVESGESLSLMARHDNLDSYVSCDFSDKSVRVQEHLPIGERTLGKQTVDVGLVGKEKVFGIAVKGSSINCMVNDVPVLGARGLSASLSHGGIGVYAWSPHKGAARAIISNVAVHGI